MNHKIIKQRIQEARTARDLDKALAILYNEFLETKYTYRWPGNVEDTTEESRSFLEYNEALQSFMSYDGVIREMARDREGYHESGFFNEDCIRKAIREQLE